jgi:excisionase family DNA binding protein
MIEPAVRQEWLSIQETATMLGVSTKHIRRAIKQGSLACSNVGGTARPTYRIARVAIAKWMDDNRVKTMPTRTERDAVADEFFSKKRRQSAVSAA